MSLRAAAINNSHVGGFNLKRLAVFLANGSCIYHGFVDSVLRHVLIGGTFTLMGVSSFGPLCLKWVSNLEISWWFLGQRKQ